MKYLDKITNNYLMSICGGDKSMDTWRQQSVGGTIDQFIGISFTIQQSHRAG